MKKTLAKVLSLVLALCLLCGSALAANDQRPVDVENFYAESEKIYMNVLGEFYTEYMKALENPDASEKLAMMALAEAKMLESGIFIPLTSKGGNYSISRVAPKTANTTMWGNDSDRFHNVIVVDTPIKAAEREEMKAKWLELRGTGTYEAWAKEYLTGKGYTISDTYAKSYNADPQTWDPLNTYRSADSEAIVNTYDGLMEYDMENVQQPALAESYTVSEDGLKYTFTIRKGVVWVDNQGREVANLTADDFVAGMQHLLDAKGGLESLVGAAGCNILNADEYTSGEITDFSEVGVKALDAYTLEYTLAAPCTYFLSMLGYNPFAPLSRSYYTSQGGKFGEEFSAEAEDYLYGKDPDHIAYCGPYVVTNLTAENTIVFKANEKYWNAENIAIKNLIWKFNDGKDATKAYNDMKAGEIAGCGLNASALELAKADGMFDEYVYTSDTDATSYMGFVNVNRHQFVNYNDETKGISTMTAEEAERAHTALQNAHFRRALVLSLDRGTYNAQSVGEDLKNASLINSYTPGNFMSLEKEVTVEINGVETTFAAGTWYGEIMQAQLNADESTIKVWDAERGESSGFDGWYNVEAAKAEMAKAVEELAAEGLVIDKDHPIKLDLPFYSGSTIYVNRSEAFKNSVEAALDGQIIINKVACETAKDWYYAGYYPDNGYEMNADIMDVSGWGPDYGDPQSYLNTMLPYGDGDMVKSLGLFD